jgi:Tfp pilus assembly protein PilN
MIKINLLPADQRKKKKGARKGGGASSLKGSGLIAVFGVAMILEVGGLMWWQSQQQEASDQMLQAQKPLKEEIERLKKVKKKGAELKKFKKKVEAQRVVFAALENGKVGPLNTLIFLSYALQKVDATLPEEEYAALTKHWTPQDMKQAAAVAVDNEWDPNRVWLKRVKDEKGEIVIEGEAKDHEDVMSFLRRLRTATYFEGIDLVEQQRETVSDLTAGAGDFATPFISFTLKGLLNYDPAGYPGL